ncbi:hypothetical protein SprV_0100049100 [Sparganum proliferum]
MSAVRINPGRTSFSEALCSCAYRAAGVGHVIYKNSLPALYITDKYHPIDFIGSFAFLVYKSKVDVQLVTTIFAANEDIIKGQLVVCFLLHRKLNVWEDSIETSYERRYLIPFDDDEGITHMLSPEFRSVVLETSDSSRCRTASATSPEIDELIGVPFTCS